MGSEMVLVEFHSEASGIQVVKYCTKMETIPQPIKTVPKTVSLPKSW